MNLNPPSPTGGRKWLWPIIGVVLLAAWTVYSHVTWLHCAPHLQAVPAFFLGVLVLLIVTVVVRLCVGVWKRGLRWFISREAWRLYGWTVVFTVSAVVLFYNIELWRGKRAWASVVREAKARGESLDYDTLLTPQPPNNQNFAKAPLFAPIFETPPLVPFGQARPPTSPQLDEVQRFAVRLDRGGTPFASWLAGHETQFEELWNFHFRTNRRASLASSANTASFSNDAGADFGRRGIPFIPRADTAGFANDAAAAVAILAELEKQRPILDELRPFSERGECWFPLDGPPGSLLSRQGAAMNGLLRVLRLRASAELASGRAGAAFSDVQFILRLADYGRQKPQPASTAYARHHLAVVDALQPLWEGLTKRRWTAAQIAELQRQLEGLNLLDDYPEAVRADALTMATLVESLIPSSSPKPARKLFDTADEQRTLDWVRLVYPTGWSLQNQAAIHRFHLETTSRYLEPAERRMVGERHGEPRGLFTSSDPLFPTFMTPKVWQMFDDASESFPFAQTAVDLATLACALERYRLAHGEFPPTLAELAPQFVAKLPRDIITGELLKYRRTDGGGFVLYSVGFNQTDDGGKPCVRQKNWQGQPEPRFDLDQNDWVWTCPSAQPTK
jgi:hypothetical protein